nr:DEAD/DEAH box helicase [uncultured Flavobacterium sp.]
MEISKKLNIWIAESESWQSFIDFELPDEEKAKYRFLRQYDDFYISLMSNAIKIIKTNVNDAEKLLALAKGLEIFSLEKKRDNFRGVNHANNMLYAAGLYFLADYSASAWILSKIYKNEEHSSDVDIFIADFLKKEISTKTQFNYRLKKYLISGDPLYLRSLKRKINKAKLFGFEEGINLYFSSILAEALIYNFEKNNLWTDLLEIRNEPKFWKEYIVHSINKKVPIWSFFPSQKLALQKGLLSDKTCSLQMPTSSGKTSITELIIYNEFKKDKNCKILYLAPYRALASELKQTLAINLSKFGVSSKTIYGGNLPTIEERAAINDVNLLISTPEKFMAIEDIFNDVSENFSTIICDEGHLLDDNSRGLSYELLLSRLKNSKDKKRFIFISAIIPNISTVNSWLGGTEKTLIESDYRPTELEFAFLNKMNKVDAYYLDINPHKEQPYNYQLYNFLTHNELKKPDGKKITSKIGLSVAVSLKATNSGTVALFAPHKRGNTGVEGLANETLSQLINNDFNNLIQYTSKSYLSSLSEYFSFVFGDDYLLTHASQYGFLYHHGDFPQNVREIIEDALRKNKIRFVICTNTLAEGVNLPIKTIVIHSTKRYNPDVRSRRSSLKIRDLKNLVGRAGRAGKETRGLVIIPHEDDFNIIHDLANNQNIEPVNGQLYNIIKLITDYLKKERLPIEPEILDTLSENFQEFLDNIDESMIDLLSEEVKIEELHELVIKLISETLSFYQANDNEKQTLTTLFELRIEKLKPIVENNQFNVLKYSGANIRLYDDIISNFNFDDNIWETDFDILDENWLNYILDDGIFKLKRFDLNLSDFNEINNCTLNSLDIKKTIISWINGKWFHEISEELHIQIHQTLRLVNSFLSFNIQSVVSSIIRIKELKDEDYNITSNINNWPSMLVYGVNSQLKLDLIEMGLIDRIAVVELSRYLEENKYSHFNFNELKQILARDGDEISVIIKSDIPILAYNKLKEFINNIRYYDI